MANKKIAFSAVFQRSRRLLLASVFAAGALGVAPAIAADVTLLNVSYDVARELYKDINPAFEAQYKQQTGKSIEIKQSHGGSSKQARAVADGLEASVVTMNQANDIDMLADRGLVAKDWAKKFPNNAAPSYSTMVYLVRKGNPKGIKDWSDLAKPGVKVVIPNPKTAGNGRYTYLAAWGSVLQNGGNDAQARELVTKIFKNVPVLDGGGRAATTTFTQRQIGDVLVTFENEVNLVRAEFGDNFDIVYPSVSILAESPVAVVDKVVDKKGIRKEATAYLNFLYSEAGQEIIAKHYLRPRSQAVAKKYAAQFKPIKLFTVDDVFGGWRAAQKRHFDDGGEFDKIYTSK
ncbi:sulfate transport system substrate-binding protein [Pseudoduganella flava]|uniref:Sulfate ABC transporter substrate-binding protein n=1 Tax=Pseudoduganella flava TaxID=871742 RepID=A0A562PZX0_9BURK|nr:sulfate ABC transporter substrate-binding protein [Pseudoduganella flava]QGZ38465.1 sulfate ABC transporter substrate-binding protein [Pseudoduganella flava]TWI49985.1 sulfate transport system substrate-binding protein [Pseudoduganella flava]